MLTLYIDESGDHNLQKINPDYPCFVLGGVLVDEDYHDNVITPEMNSLKKAFFNTSNVNLHLYDVKRQRGTFGRLSVESTRKRFWAEWRKLMRRWDYTVIACVIDKPAHVAKYASDADDPYDYALKVLVERLTMHLNDCDDTGRIVAEARRRDLDSRLSRVYKRFENHGTRAGTDQSVAYVQPNEIQARVSGIELRTKVDNVAGLQLADFLMNPIGRHVLGKRDGPGWLIAEKKFRRNPENGEYDGWGLIELPD